MYNVIANMDTTEKTVLIVGLIMAIAGIILIVCSIRCKTKKFITIGLIGQIALVGGITACGVMCMASNIWLNAIENIPETVQEYVETRETLMTELENGLTPLLSYKIAKYNDDVTQYKAIWYDRASESDWDAMQPIEIYIDYTLGTLPEAEPPAQSK